MKRVVCPQCGSERVYHYTDVYVVREPVLRDDGQIRLVDFETEEFADFFMCRECEFRPKAEELIASAV
jgi:rubredoxin